MLRDYQGELIEDGLTCFRAGCRAVLFVLATGGGKTVTMAALHARNVLPSRAIAHRQELVGQISLALARAGVVHGIEAPQGVVRFIIQLHVQELGRSYVDERSTHRVVGVDTLNARGDAHADDVDLVSIDEAHHLVVGNKWHRAVQRYRRARLSGWTATPIRADGRKLSRASGQGVFDALVQGPSDDELTRRGYLCEYVVIGPPSSIDRGAVAVSETTGDFVPAALTRETQRSRIVGDIVGTYLRFAPGEIGLTFAVDVAMAEQHAAAFLQAGVPAAVVTAKTKNRDKLVSDLGCGILKQIAHVDIFGEGTDVPVVKVVSFGRATKSFPLFAQHVGRVRRPSPGKLFGIAIDHVGNFKEHGMPNGIERWEMDEEPQRRRQSRGVPVRTCTNPECFRAYEGYSLTCPYCGARPAPVEATRPEIVEGDLTEYGPELLEQLRQKAAEACRLPSRPPRSGKERIQFDHMAERAAAQADLKEAMAWWAGARNAEGMEDSAAYRLFYSRFGVDAYSAQSMTGPKMRQLADMVRKDTWGLVA